MDLVRCLYFDDDPKQLQRYAGWIKRAWDKLNTGVPIDVSVASSADEAELKLKETEESFDLFVCDLLVGRKNEQLGLPAIAHAREDYPKLAIVALSVGDAVLERKALDAGANEFVPKQYVTENPTKNLLGEKMLSALRTCGREPTSSKANVLKFDDETDLPLASLIETVGRENVINFASRTLRNRCTEIHPAFVRSGLSGASVIRADCAYEIVDGDVKRTESQSLLLKISRSKDGLMEELKKDVSGFPEELFIRFAGDEPIQSENWYAIASRFKLGAQTLIDWLITRVSSPREIESALNTLFINPDRGLRLVYQSVGSSNERPNVSLWHVLTLGRRARVRQAIEELKQLVKNYDALGIFSEQLINNFMVAKQVDDLTEESFRPGASYCLSHGDLHGRNILVSQTFYAFLIDPANVGHFHWAADIARLMVDLSVSAWDAGYKSHEWHHMAEWVAVTQALIRDEMPDFDGPRDSPNARVHTSLRWLRRNLFEIHRVDDHKLKPEWEFRLALAVEFMRAAYREQDLTSPKRVLGLISACDALRQASVAYRVFLKS